MALSTASLAHLDGVHGDLRAVMLRAAEIAPDLKWDITDGQRSLAEQRENVRKGVSKTLDSRHVDTPAKAVDILPFRDGKDAWKFPEGEQVDLFRPVVAAIKVAAAELGVPVEWGQDLWGWDAPHIQLSHAQYPKGSNASLLDKGAPFDASRFGALVEKVLDVEGGWNPADPSMHGVTLDTLRLWRPGASLDELKALTPEAAKQIYRALFWHAVDGDSLPPGLDYALFDFAVHSGPATAVMHLQDIVGTMADGVVGPVTRAAVRQAEAAATIAALMDARWAYMQGRDNFAANAEGWAERVDKVGTQALMMAAQAAPDPEPAEPKTPAPEYSVAELAAMLAKAMGVPRITVSAGFSALPSVHSPTGQGPAD